MRPRGRLGLLAFGIASLVLCACASRGKELFTSEGCVTCHRFGGRGGEIGPDLTEVGRRRDAAFIRRQISDPTANNPNSRMPSFGHLTWFEIRSLAAYLGG